MRDDRRTSMEGERLSTNSIGIIDENGSRPLSQTSSEMDSVGPLQPVKHRDKPKLQVSRLEIRKLEIDQKNFLPLHIRLKNKFHNCSTCSFFVRDHSQGIFQLNRILSICDITLRQLDIICHLFTMSLSILPHVLVTCRR